LKPISESDLKSLNWYGVKSAIRSAVVWRPLNLVVVFLARQVLSTKLASRIPVVQRAAVFITASGHAVKMLNPSRDDVARDVFWHDGQRGSPADRLVMRCHATLCRDADFFFDVGAFSGLFSLVAAKENSRLRAFAYEILPESFLLLNRNIIENDVITIVEARLKGLANNRGTVVLPIDIGLHLPSSLSIGSSFREGVQVPLVTLDEEAANIHDRRVLIKIDVEGFELAVLEGASSTLARLKPDIICEILPDATATAEIQALLEPLGYKFMLFTDNGLLRLKEITPRDDGRDWLFTTRDDAFIVPRSEAIS
jgi:FkbM family methyltransferase